MRLFESPSRIPQHTPHTHCFQRVRRLHIIVASCSIDSPGPLRTDTQHDARRIHDQLGRPTRPPEAHTSHVGHQEELARCCTDI